MKTVINNLPFGFVAGFASGFIASRFVPSFYMILAVAAAVGLYAAYKKAKA